MTISLGPVAADSLEIIRPGQALRSCILLAMVAASPGGYASAQTSNENGKPIGQASESSGAPAKDATAAKDRAGLVDEDAAARAKLAADTHMLVVLSRELRAEAARNSANTFSLRMVKKSEEIQKLAAVVRQEMAALK